METHLRHGARTGFIFGIIVIFLAMIGFTIIASQLIEGLAVGKTVRQPDIRYLAIFLGLIGLWAGATASKAGKSDQWSSALGGSLAAGLVAGLLVGGFTLLVGTLIANGADIRKYLPELSKKSVEFFQYKKDPMQGALTHLALFTGSALLGGLIARGVFRASWRRNLSQKLHESRLRVENVPAVRSTITNPILRYVVMGLIMVFALTLPLRIGQYWNYNLGTIGIYVLLGLGLNIVVGLAGLLDLGYVAFFAIGAYTVALLTAPEPHGLLFGFWLALPIAVVLAALAGVLLGVPVLRMRGDYLAIVTLGFGEIIRVLSRSDVLSDFTAGPRGVRAIAGPTMFGKPFNDDISFVYLIFFAVLLVIYVTIRLKDSRIGRAWVAMREDETVAQAMGIDTLKIKLLAFAIGAAFAGLGGVLFASRNQFTGPEDHTLMVSINVLALVIVGGMGSIPGVILGALTLKGLPEVLRELENYRILFFGALLVVMMILRPEGLWPSNRRRLEMHDVDQSTVVEIPPQNPEGEMRTE